ncbi:MAG: hypothetical protein FD121_445 [Gallionellaceae bacterium]|nr:MAG: hypothetical protein FD121_445 [Gallionellaceae bacterium]
MKSPHVHKKYRFDAFKASARQDEAKLLARRLTDITPASREMSESHDAPTSPKLHELIERSKYH